MLSVGDLSTVMAVIAVVIPADTDFMPAEVQQHLPVLHLMGAVMFFTPGISDGVWRWCAVAFFLAYARKVTTELPHTREHLTLWLQILFAVSTALSGNTKVLHSAAFISAHTLLVGYLILLYFVGEGDLVKGFYDLDVAQYNGDELRALAHTIILHLWPMMMVHAELGRFGARLSELYAGSRSWVGFLWMAVVSPAILPLVYEQVQVSKHGSIDAASHINYKVPTDAAPTMAMVTKAVCIPLQLGLFRVLVSAVGKAPQPSAAAKKAD